MEVTEAITRLNNVASTCGSPDATSLELRAALGATTELQSYIAARRADLVLALDAQPGAFPEAAIADTSGCSLAQANREKERAKTLDVADAFADALSDGTITTGHVDAFTRASNRLDEAQRAGLFDQHEQLATAASSQTIAEFDRHVARAAKALDTTDGTERLERQQRATRLRTWTDNDGMWCLRGTFDPLLGKDLARRIRDATSAAFRDETPATAPDDPLERQQHLQGLALAKLINGPASKGSGAGAPLVVVDATRTIAVHVGDGQRGDGQRGDALGPIIDWGIPVELPLQVLFDVFDVHDPDVVIVANGVVLHAPGRTDLGRSSRLANGPQRRALRGLYDSCGVPGCTVHYDRCKLHHIIWWRNGGRTDLDNLLPVCQHHHTKIHADHWQIALDPQRNITITLPDGQVMRSEPPSRRTA